MLSKPVPFLANPDARRRTTDLPEAHYEAAGIPVSRNPGVACVWTTRRYTPFTPPDGGILFRLGEPTATAWYAAGRPAQRAEVLESLASGLPVLRLLAEQDGADAQCALEAQIARAMALVPEEGS